MERWLLILEVSKKQDFIFSSNLLKENIERSGLIEKVTSVQLFKEIWGEQRFSEQRNLVYSGGGHAVLEFSGKEDALDFSRKISEELLRKYPALEVFIRVKRYEEQKTARQNLIELLKLFLASI